LQQYYDLLQKVLDTGNDADDRTGTGTLSLFGEQLSFDLTQGFPLLTGKFTSFKMIAAELLWILSGSTNNTDLKTLNGNDKPTIWEEWATKDGNLGRIYGHQWRKWGDEYNATQVDQIAALIDGLKTRPFSRRHIVSAWNVTALPDESISPQENVAYCKMALAPCHAFFQFGVRRLSLEERHEWCINHTGVDALDYSDVYSEEFHQIYDTHGVPRFSLSCQLTARSQDLFLGTPYNIASYSLLVHMIGNLTNMIPDKLHIAIGDAHLYKNHIVQAEEMLSRNLNLYSLPRLEIDKKYESIDDFTLSSFKIIGYESHPRIAAPIAI
jgi:thymidylate synthase